MTSSANSKSRSPDRQSRDASRRGRSSAGDLRNRSASPTRPPSQAELEQYKGYVDGKVDFYANKWQNTIGNRLSQLATQYDRITSAFEDAQGSLRNYTSAVSRGERDLRQYRETFERYLHVAEKLAGLKQYVKPFLHETSLTDAASMLQDGVQDWQIAYSSSHSLAQYLARIRSDFLPISHSTLTLHYRMPCPFQLARLGL